MRIYVAAEYGRKDEVVRDVVPLLAADGHRVTSRWLLPEGQPVFEDSPHGDSAARRDLSDVEMSDAILVLTRPLGTMVRGGGRFFEAGFAYGLSVADFSAKIRVVFVGGKETVFCHLSNVEHYATLDEARAALRE